MNFSVDYWKRTCWLSALVGMVLPAFGTAGENSPTGNLLKGSWQIVLLRHRGKLIDPKESGTIQIEFTDQDLVVVLGDAARRASYTFNQNKRPREIDLVHSEGTLKSRIYPGIFQMAGDELCICFNERSRLRPTDFKSNLGQEVTLVVLKRKNR